MKNNDNKTKKRIGIVAIMLVLLLAVGATAGITLAKYISSATVQSQTATVAKWGYTLTADGSGLFGTNYGNVSDNFATKVSDNGVVVSSTSNNVVAPGTKGSATILTINGSSEVDAVLTIDVSNFQTIHLTDGSSLNYYPIKWKMNGTEIGTSNVVTANDFASAIATALQVQGVLTGATVKVDNSIVTVNLPASTASINNFQLTLSWEWALSTPKDSSGYYDAEDTILGQIANAGGTTGAAFTAYNGSVWQINLGLSASVEQVQKFESQNP